MTALAAILLALQEPPPSQEVVPVPAVPAPTVHQEWFEGGALHLAMRVGAWFTPEFEALTPLGGRRIREQSIGDAGVDLGMHLGHVSLRASIDVGFGDDVTALVGGLHLGIADKLPLEDVLPCPLVAEGSIGLLAGKLDVDASGFGDFDPAIGFQARLELAVPISPCSRVSLWLDYRRLDFEFDETVLSGDDEAFGSTFALGAGFTLRF